MRIEIGGGTIPADGYTNLDPVHGAGDWQRQAQTRWPTDDATVEAVRASHVLEHIPAGHDRIDVMNEAWRVLIPGGDFYIIGPVVPQGPDGIGWHAFADPTHVSFWVYPESWLYFCDGPYRANADYGIRLWEWEEDSELIAGWEAHVHLRKPRG